jgi:hypothetical protein
LRTATYRVPLPVHPPTDHVACYPDIAAGISGRHISKSAVACNRLSPKADVCRCPVL